MVHDLAVTSLLRTAIDLACWAGSVTEATVDLDLCLQAGLTLPELQRRHPAGDAVPCRPGSDRAQQARVPQPG